MKKFLLSLFLILMTFSFASCKNDDVENTQSDVSEVSQLAEPTLEEEISGLAFETRVDEDGNTESYIFFEDYTFYHISQTRKTGTWSMDGDKLTITLTKEDENDINEVKTVTVAILPEVGISLDGTLELMVVDNNINRYLNSLESDNFEE